MSMARIVVVGGGAGGLELVSRLGRKLGRRGKAEIVLVDRNSTHIWKPLLHEVATGALDSGLDEVSYQGHAGINGYQFQRGTLSGLDREKRQLSLAPVLDESGAEVLPSRTLDYDVLVLSLGSVSNDFGTPGVAEYCHFLDSPGQAEAFRHDMLNTFLRYSDPEQQALSRLTVGIVGAGATGVEECVIVTQDGTRIETDLCVWAAGIKAPEFLSTLGLSTEPNHRIKVFSTLQSLDDPHIFVFGDCASCPQEDGSTVPPRAQAAHQQALLLYRNLRARLDGKPLKPFVYRDRGSLISLAHFDAVGSLMRGASARSLFLEGHLAKFFYASLYRMHQRAIHGTVKTVLMVIVDGLNFFLKPRMKLH